MTINFKNLLRLIKAITQKYLRIFCKIYSKKLLMGFFSWYSYIWSVVFLEKVLRILDQLFKEKMRAIDSEITQDWFLNSVIPKNIYKYWKIPFFFLGNPFPQISKFDTLLSFFGQNHPFLKTFKTNISSKFRYPNLPFWAKSSHLESCKFANTPGFESTTSSDCNGTQTQNHLLHKRTLDPSAKLVSHFGCMV